MVDRDSDLLERDEGLPLPLSLFKLIYFSYSEMLEQNHGLSKVFSSHATLWLKLTEYTRSRIFFIVVFHADLSPGGYIIQITLLIWGMEFLPSPLSDVCPTRELLEEAGVAMLPGGFVALSGFVLLGVEQPFS